MNASTSQNQAARPVLTKIIATLGPASTDAATVRKLIEAGVSVFRLNFSHGDLEGHTASVRMIRAVSAEAGRPVGILGDLQGPKIRVGKVEEGGVEAVAGSVVIMQRQALVATASLAPLRLSSTHAGLVDDLEPGHRVLINDGAVRMLVVAKRADEVECTVTVGGQITSGKGINLPDSSPSIDSITKRDWEHMAWAVRNELDFLALSFVRDAEDVRRLRGGLEKAGGAAVQIIAKIELPGAVQNAETIIDAADGIMVARGDLGVEMDLARVPVIQQQLLTKAQSFGKPCIVATQMLESMIHAPSPTRAEASDVATAIFSGSDAVMLSGETAVGKYPIYCSNQLLFFASHRERGMEGVLEVVP